MKFIILGCGSSLGVPWPNGFFGNCNLENKKNYRTRCSALIQTKNENILIDTSPDLRHQLLKNRVKNIDKVLYSHMHADQTHGINDLRVFFMISKKTIPVYADKMTKNYLLKTFNYCFKKNSNEYPAILKMFSVKKNFYIKNGKQKISMNSVNVKHGNINSVCYILDKKLAYISDVSDIKPKDLKFFKNLKYLIIDCLRIKSHPSHFNLEKSLELIQKLSPKKAILTNLHTDLDYDYLKKILPKNIEPAYDGLTVKL